MEFFVFSAGMLLTLTIYHLFVYIGRKSDKLNLYFSIFVFCSIYAIYGYGIYPLLRHSSLSYLYYPKAQVLLAYSSSMLNLCVFFIFLSYALELDRAKKYSWIFAIFTTIATFITYLLYLKIGSSRPPMTIFSKIAMTCGLLLYIYIISKYFASPNKRRKSWQLNIAFCSILYILSILLFTVFHALNYSTSYQVLSVILGMFIMALGSAHALTRQFNKEHVELIEMKKDLENKVIQRTAELEKANKEKTDAFVNLAHEIKTPLTLLNTSLESYIDKVGLDDDLREMNYSVNCLLKDTLNFLDSEKLERGQIFYDHDQVTNLSDLLSHKLYAFQKLALKKEIKITHTLGNSICAKIDPSAADRIINNLLDNAIKYNRQGGSVAVSLGGDGTTIRLVVEDTGVGITDEEQHAIFNPYYQSSRKKRNVQGIGMGLYNTAQIINSVNGIINVESKIDRGSKFVITLKQYALNPGEVVQNDLSLSEPIEGPTSRDITDIFDEAFQFTALIVEDNIGLLLSLRNNFSKKYNVICSRNGQEALARLAKYDNKPDIIISDIMMDHMDGYELFDAIQKIDAHKDIPFIFLTAKTTEKEKIEGLKKGAIDYINKPFSMDVLIAKVQSILEYNLIRKNIFRDEKYRTIGMLTGSISHEILNPVSGILGPLDVLEKKIQPIIPEESKSEVDEAIYYIRTNSNRIKDTVTSLRTLFHGESHTLEIVDLGQFTEELIKFFRQKLRDRISFHIHIPKKILIETSSSALAQIFINLISNSIDAIIGQGEIRFIGSYDKNKPTIEISDNGSGINPMILNKIFDLGFTSKKDGKGTGMGLYIVKELCNSLNVTISCESQPGIGTKFILQFPDNHGL